MSPYQSEEWFTPEAERDVDARREHAAEALAKGADFAEVGRLQSEAQLCRFFLEQARGPSAMGPSTSRIIERDFGDRRSFDRAFVNLATDGDVEFIVMGLSFESFRFHLYPISAAPFGVPFGITVAIVACTWEPIVVRSGLERPEFARRQLRDLHWALVERRIDCMQEPLDILGNDFGHCEVLPSPGGGPR